tara:strand:+ start:6367 stop:6870 length:504 start_codon:yes stop_codon:yes gene_type:complete
MRALFISEKYVKENSAIDENTDYKKILPTIWQCQIQYLQNLLGTKLYNDLITKVIAGTIAGDDETLMVDYVSDALLYWVQYELQIPLLYEYRNKNVSTNRSDDATPISLKDSYRIENRFKDKAEFFSKRLSDYLCANSTLYPLFCTETKIDEVKPHEGKAGTNLYLR